MNNPIKVVFSSISPAKSVSPWAIAINTASPEKSTSPAFEFGRPIVNTVSPDKSLSPAAIEFSDGRRLDISPDMLVVAEPELTKLLSQIGAIGIDSLITKRLLTADEVLRTDARKLLSLKVQIIAELFANDEIRHVLRKRIDAVLKAS